jgi:hypothetical protein
MESPEQEITQTLATENPRRGVAPIWHTVLLVAFLLTLSLLNALAPHSGRGGRSLLPMYGETMAMEWAMVAYIVWGIRRRGGSLRTLIGGRWQHFEDILMDVAVAAGFIIAWFLFAGVLTLLLQRLPWFAVGDTSRQIADAKRHLGAVIPQTGLEMLAFIGVSLTAGFCEEVIFRGYLQQQFARWTRSVWIALPLSALCFGLSHGYEGGLKMVLVGLLGLGFGLLATWRKSLRPSMMAHATYDIMAGLLMRLLFSLPPNALH